MSKPNLPPVNQVKIFCNKDMGELARDLGGFLGTPGLSVQNMLQSESMAYSSMDQCVIGSVTVTVVYRQYEVPVEALPEEKAPTGEETVILPREESLAETPKTEVPDTVEAPKRHR